jgi:tRNA (guanine-N7-)-methyltransferase
LAESDRPRRILYGRRQGRPLRPGRRQLLELRLPGLRIELAPGLDPRTLFRPEPAEIWLELGFGGGEHLAETAKRNPGVGCIGAEPFQAGVARLLALIEAEGLDNIRIHPDDGRTLIEALAPASIRRCYILFPDPWPKLRHHKRRLVRRETLDQLARVMSDGAILALASDDADYVEWMRSTALAHPAFRGLRWRPEETGARPEGWIATRYEAKALAKGLRPHYLMFERRERAGTPGQSP